jgi:colanic acid biosynthesis glycosyl transferase WcaI
VPSLSPEGATVRFRDSKGSSQKPRLLVLNQYYWPGLEATAHLLHDLCQALTKDFEVTVVTGMLSIAGVKSGKTMVDGVTVIRVGSTAYDRRRLALRGLNYGTYLLQALRTSLRLPRQDIVFCMTDPPMIGDVGLIIARRFGAPLVVTSQDVFPEVALELGRLRSRTLIGLLRVLVQLYLRRATRVVAIGETMARRLEVKGAPPERIRVIPNWVSSDQIAPQPRDNVWARENDLVDRFVIMHSGNVGHAQDLESVVRAASFLRDMDDLTIAIIGRGARWPELFELSNRLETESVRFLPYQPRETLSLSLSSADIHVVGLAGGLSGYVVPSRVYGILSVGRPVIVTADSDSETAQLVEGIGAGIVLPPGRPELVADAIRRVRAGEFDLEAMGRRAREYVVENADREIAVRRYLAVLGEVLP